MLKLLVSAAALEEECVCLLHAQSSMANNTSLLPTFSFICSYRLKKTLFANQSGKQNTYIKEAAYFHIAAVSISYE